MWRIGYGGSCWEGQYSILISQIRIFQTGLQWLKLLNMRYYKTLIFEINIKCIFREAYAAHYHKEWHSSENLVFELSIHNSNPFSAPNCAQYHVDVSRTLVSNDTLSSNNYQFLKKKKTTFCE